MSGAALQTDIVQSHPSDIEPMRRALRLAMTGRGAVEPNPMVGCVIVKNGIVIGQGYHQTFGGPHAEPNALAACKEDPTDATMYVTLEPCCHLKKKTPPCTPKIIASGIRRVVIGCVDPNPMVAGKGIAQLRSAGLTVDEGILCSESKQLNAAFFKKMDARQPYVTLKWAQSADGKVAGAGGQRLYISNTASHKVLHGLRSRCDAIVVGIGTVLADDPLLTARGVQQGRSLLRIVLDKDLRIPVSSQLARTTAHGPVLVYCAETVYRQRHAAVAALNAHGVEVLPLRVEAAGSLSLLNLLNDLGGRGVMHLLVEAGPTLAASFLTQNLADRVWIFRSPQRIEDTTAPAAPKIDFPVTAETMLDGDRLSEYLNPAGPVFFSLERSADFANLA